MSSRYRAFAFVASGIFVAACGGETDSGVATGNVTGAFTVMTDVPSAGSTVGASYTRKGGFTSAQPTCATQRIGTCDVDPCYASALIASGTSLVNAGSVTIGGAALNANTLDPESDDAYASNVVDGQIAWTTGGQNVSITWAHFPGDATSPGGTLSLQTPPFITLSSGSPFADNATSTLTRGQDLTLAWTNESAPQSQDEVNVNLQSGATQIDCTFKAAAGSGVVPSVVLQYLAAGQGTFDVHSKQYVAQKLTGANGAAWTLQLNVDAHARTSYGLAHGPVTIE